MRRTALVGIAALAVGACLGGPSPDPSAFFQLSRIAPEQRMGPIISVAIGVGPVTLPGYLDRPQIVTRVSDYEIRLADSDRWAEPLAENLVRAFEGDLEGFLPGSTFVDYPWYAADAPDYAVAIDVQRFEADETGTVLLVARWALRWPGQPEGTQIDGGGVRIEEQAEGPDRAASIAAHSRALVRLAEPIAAAVRRAEGP